MPEIMSKQPYLPDEEILQLQRTVEMFEAITRAQPDDYQSLEILKEAYLSLGQTAEALRTALRLVDAYEKQGQFLKAILECEGILQDHPNQPGVRERLAQLVAHARQPVGEPFPTPVPAASPAASPVAPVAERTQEPTKTVSFAEQAEEGDRALAEVLIAEKLATAQALEPLLVKLHAMRNMPQPAGGMPLSLVHLVAHEQFAKLEDLLTVMVNKSMLPYLPLANYDVDADVARLLPLPLSWQFCVAPFDQISRCILVATSNPFQTAARRTVENTLRCRVFWYVAAPADIAAVLKRAHRLENL
ncbi:MAG: hypothetical protein N3B01_03190 [Verrucomicrobiae bacterium]|nr:hypothetical protein [Verrucomicrobiae bacterium]